jgi:hypothetical protein
MKNKRKIFLSVVLPLSSAIAMEGNRQMNNRSALPKLPHNMYAEIIGHLPIEQINQMDKLSKEFHDQIVTKGVKLSNTRELERNRGSNQYRNKKIIPTISLDKFGYMQDIQNLLRHYPGIVYSGTLNSDNNLGAFNRIHHIFDALKRNKLNFFYHTYENKTNAAENVVKLLISNRDMEQLQPDARQIRIEQYQNIHPDLEIWIDKSTPDENGTLINQQFSYDKQKKHTFFKLPTKVHRFYGYRQNSNIHKTQ